MNIALTTLAAFSLGAMHALEPGHGKTFISSYLLTGRSTRAQLLIMGFSMAFAHTFVLLGLALIMMLLSAQMASVLQEGLVIGSPVLVIAIGIFMIYRMKVKKKTCGCKSHACDQHSLSQPATISNKTAAMVGFTGGLLPCPSAVAVFSLSGSSGNPTDAFCMMLLYVTGFIFVMSMLIIAASFIKNNIISRYFNQNRTIFIQKVSAYAILLTGVAYLVHNIVDHM